MIEKRMAYIAWYPNYAAKQQDREITPFLKLEKPRPGVLQRAREAVFLSTRSVAIRMGISQSSYAELEANEKRGAISLCKLERAAEAMDCELIYTLRPKNRRHYSWQVWEKLFSEVNSERVFGPTPLHRALQIARTARKIMIEQDFRRRHEWSQRWAFPEEIDKYAPPDYLKNL